jgi:rhamnosyltransferase subunit B
LEQRRKFILVPAGSSGDIYPFVWLGKGLASLGHEVVVVVHRPFDRTMEAAGLRVVPYGTDEDFEKIIRHPDLWHPRRGFELVVRAASLGYPEALPRIRGEIAPGRTLLVGAGIAFPARIVAEAAQVPLVTVQLQPIAFMSVADPPVLGVGFEWFLRAPRWVRLALYRFGDILSDRVVAPEINSHRARLGLMQPARRIMRDYWMSPFKVLGLFPDWYGPKREDWPPQAVTTRFPLYDEGDRTAVSPATARFLAEGPAPVLFTPGSANAQARRFFEVGLEACVRLRARGLFLTRFSEQLPAALPPGITHAAYAPFSQVFPQCSAVVHHGGIGTVAQGLAAGVPQLVMAMSHDQPDNGYRITRLGVGAYLYPKTFTPQRVTNTLAQLTSSPGVASACREYRSRVERQMPAEAVFRLLEEAHRTACG